MINSPGAYRPIRISDRSAEKEMVWTIRVCLVTLKYIYITYIYKSRGDLFFICINLIAAVVAIAYNVTGEMDRASRPGEKVSASKIRKPLISFTSSVNKAEITAAIKL